MSPYLVQGIYLGGALQQETSFSANRVISEKTANLLRKFMQTVVVEGSGQLATPKTGGAGGKTASAQTGIYDELFMRGSVGFTQLRTLSLPL